MKMIKIGVAIATVSLVLSGAVMAEGMKKSDGMKKEMPMTKGDDKKMMKPPFGGAEDIAFAKQIWEKLHAKGYDALQNNLYVGGPPHGKVREVIEGVIDGQLVISKTNYGGDGVSIEAVKKDPKAFLKAVTIMVKRPGFDPEDKDWFWAKYKPDGTIFTNEKGMKLVGKVAKGMPVGCISCHASASGNDLVFSHNGTVNADVTWIGDKSMMGSFAELMK